ncbi:MAG: hypothetical protein K8R21_00950, partial [Leptospira sp.]|nr:hypothetical protein [Leptospira sp.]
MTILVKPAFLTIILLLTDCYLFSDKKGENPGFIESSQNRLKEFLLETTNEPIFLEKANIRELLKSKIQKENSILESYLRKRLINDGIADKLVNQKPVRENFKTELGFIKNLGGLRAVS